MTTDRDLPPVDLHGVVQQIELCGKHKRTPYAIANVSMTQFSVARYAGGCKYNGEHYIYWPHHDLLVRDDVHQFLLKAMKKKKPVDGTGSLLNVSVHPRRTMCAVGVQRLVGIFILAVHALDLSEIVAARSMLFAGGWWRIHFTCGSPYILIPTSAFTLGAPCAP
jgi:hypothetical protein